MADNINLDSIKTFMETNKDSEEVKSYIGGFVTPDRVNSFLESDEGKKLLQPKLDDYARKAVNSHDEKFRANELPKLVEEEYKKEHPDEDPKDTEIANLKAQFEKMQADIVHKDLVNKAHGQLDKNKAKCRWLDRFIGKDEKETKRNLDDFIKGYAEDVNAGVATRLKGGYQPPKAGKAPNLAYTVDQIKGMSPQEINEHWDDVQKTLEANK